MTDIAELAFRVNTDDIDKADKKLKELAKSGTAAGKDSTKAGNEIDTSMRKAEKGTGAAAKGMGAMGAAVKGMGALAAAAGLASLATDVLAFGKKMGEVSTLVDTSVHSMDDLREAALKQAGMFNSSPIEQASALYQAISAGALKGKDGVESVTNATELLTVANKLAIGGATDVETAIDGLTTIMNTYGDEAGDAGEISDKMFVAMKAGKTTIGELSDNFGSVAAKAQSAGVSFDEILAATAALTAGGKSTSSAMTGINAAIGAMTTPTKQAAELAKDLGLQFDAVALAEHGLVGMMDLVAEATGGNVTQMNTLFGSMEAQGAVAALTGKANVALKENMDDLKVSTDETTVAFDKMANSPGFESGRIISQLSAAFISMGGAIATSLTPALKWIADNMGPVIEMITKGFGLLGDLFDTLITELTPAFDLIKEGVELIAEGFGKLFDALAGDEIIAGLASDFGALYDVIKPAVPYVLQFAAAFLAIIGTTAALTATWGAIVSGLGLVTGAVSLVSGAFVALKAVILANPIGLAIAAIVAAAYLIYKNWEPIKAWWKELWGKITDVIDAFIEKWDAFKEKMSNIKDVISAPFEGAKEVVTGAMGGMTDAVKDAAGDMVDGAADLATGFWGKIQSTFSTGKKVSVDMANIPIDETKRVLQMQSPSRVMQKLGAFVTEGFASGIIKGGKAVTDAAGLIGKKAVEEFEKITASLDDQTFALTHTEEEYRRYGLTLRGITGDAQDNIIEHEGINAALEAQGDISKRVADVTKDLAIEQAALVLELEQGATAAEQMKFMTEGYEREEAALAVSLKESNIKLREKVRLQDDARKAMEDLTKKQHLQNIEVTQGADAAKKAELMMGEYTEAMADNYIETQNNMELQKEFYDTLKDSIANADSIKDVFKDLGTFMKDWLKEQIAEFAANKVMVFMGFGDSGAVGGLNSMFSSVGKSAEGFGGKLEGMMGTAGTAIQGLGGKIAGLFGGGVAEGPMGPDQVIQQQGAATAAQNGATPMNILAMTAAAKEIGEMFGELTGGNSEKAGIGAMLGGPLGTVVGSAFGGSWQDTKTGFDVGYSGGEVSGQSTTYKEKQKSLWGGKDRKTVYTDLDADVENTITGFFDTINNAIVTQAQAMGIAGAANIMDSFSVATASFKGETAEADLTAWLSDAAREAYTMLYDTLGPNMRDGISDSLDMTTAPIEDIAAMFTEVAIVTQGIVPVMQALGLNIGTTTDQMGANGLKLAEAFGGASEAMNVLAVMTERFGPANAMASIQLDNATQSVELWNASLGRGSTAAQAASMPLDNYIDNLMSSSETMHIAKTAMTIFGTGVDEVTGQMQFNTAGMREWANTIDTTTVAGQKARMNILYLAAAADSAAQRSFRAAEGVGSYRDSLDASTASGALALQQFDMFTIASTEVGGSMGINTAALATYRASLDLNTEAGRAADESAAALATSFGLTDNAMITTAEGMWNYIQALDSEAEGYADLFVAATQQYDALVLLEAESQRQIDTMNSVADTMSIMNMEFDKTSPLAIGASDALVQLMGGIEGFSAQTSSYYQNYFTEKEREQLSLAQSAAAVQVFNDGLVAAGGSAITTTEGMRAYIESLDTQTASGGLAFAQAMAVSDAMLAVAESEGGLEAVIAQLPVELQGTFQTMVNDATVAAEGLATQAANIYSSVEGSRNSLSLMDLAFIESNGIMQEQAAGITGSSYLIGDTLYQISTDVDGAATVIRTAADGFTNEIKTASDGFAESGAVVVDSLAATDQATQDFTVAQDAAVVTMQDTTATVNELALSNAANDEAMRDASVTANELASGATAIVAPAEDATSNLSTLSTAMGDTTQSSEAASLALADNAMAGLELQSSMEQTRVEIEKNTAATAALEQANTLNTVAADEHAASMLGATEQARELALATDDGVKSSELAMISMNEFAGVMTETGVTVTEASAQLKEAVEVFGVAGTDLQIASTEASDAMDISSIAALALRDANELCTIAVDDSILTTYALEVATNAANDAMYNTELGTRDLIAALEDATEALEDTTQALQAATTAMGNATDAAYELQNAANAADNAISGTAGQIDTMGGNASTASGQVSGLSGALSSLASAASSAMSSIKSSAQSAQNSANAANGALANLQSAASAATAIDGSNASGLARVPFDGYLSELHKDEMVMPANVSNWLRKAGVAGISNNSNTGTQPQSQLMIRSLQSMQNDNARFAHVNNQLMEMIAKGTAKQNEKLEELKETNKRLMRKLDTAA